MKCILYFFQFYCTYTYLLSIFLLKMTGKKAVNRERAIQFHLQNYAQLHNWNLCSFFVNVGEIDPCRLNQGFQMANSTGNPAVSTLKCCHLFVWRLRSHTHLPVCHSKQLSLLETLFEFFLPQKNFWILFLKNFP